MLGRTERFPVQDLNAVAMRVGWNPVASAYISKLRDRVIICPTTSPGIGHYVEREPTSILSFKSDFAILGQAVWESLLRFRSDPTVGPQKKTDWPAFKASGMKGVHAFESEYVYVSVEAFPGVLRVEARVPCKEAHELFVGRFITNSCDFEYLGELLHQTARCSMAIRNTEFGGAA